VGIAHPTSRLSSALCLPPAIFMFFRWAEKETDMV
jgi:hypothetical protein